MLERLLDYEFGTNVTEIRGIFYLDSGHSFDKVLFYGNELILFQMDLMIFVLLIIVSNNYLLSILAVGLVYKLLEFIAKYLAKSNFSRKTLIDKRFLL